MFGRRRHREGDEGGWATEGVALRTGDLFTTTAAGIGHGVNVDGLMGAGVAVEFRRRWPAMFAEYETLCREGRLLPGSCMAWERPEGGWVYNLASQDRPGRHARLDWLHDAALAALSHADENGVDTIALPQIGCGIGGLAWADVHAVLQDAQRPFWATFEVWSLPPTSMASRPESERPR